MLFIYNKCLDPYYNLAAEEYLMKNSQDEIFMLWQNDNTIVVGRNQNTLAEINYDYVKENNINVVRRMSGGGAVFHDMGNINFSFIVNSGEDFSNYDKFTRPVVDFLNSIGVKAYLKGRNDLVVDDKKISGNAQYLYKNRILHHGTLLYSACEDRLTNALKVTEDKIKSKGIKSIRSRVTNISGYIEPPVSVQDFLNMLAEYITKKTGCTPYDLERDSAQIKELANKKYSTWDWNFGYSPKYDFVKKDRFAGGSVEVCLNVAPNGIIDDIKIFGDFFPKKDLAELSKLFIGCRHERSEIISSLIGIDISDYISGVTMQEFLSVLF